MRRIVVLGVLIAFGCLSIAVAAYQVPAGLSAAALAATKSEKVKDNLYVITGSGIEDTNAFSGGNTAVFEWNVFSGFRTLSANLATELPEAVHRRGQQHGVRGPQVRMRGADAD